MTYLLFAIGFVLLIKGADFLVDGASSLAKRFGISDLIIGLTIVSFGTSAPELIVNIMATLKGAGDVGIGNIVGSNISNIALILGISAMIYPLAVQKSTIKSEIPFNILSAILLFVLVNNFLGEGGVTQLSRIDGGILLLGFAAFFYYVFKLSKKNKENLEEDKTERMSLPSSVILIIVGIVALAYGGQWVVNGAVEIAKQLGLSEALIGLTIVAVGTSLPELAASAVAAYKKNSDIAIGNVVGSNLFNILWVLGLSAVISPIDFSPKMNVDIGIFGLVAVLLFLFSAIGKKKEISRWKGAVFVLGYAAYVVFLVIRG